jgi:hypothetical protein
VSENKSEYICDRSVHTAVSRKQKQQRQRVASPPSQHKMVNTAVTVAALSSCGCNLLLTPVVGQVVAM